MDRITQGITARSITRVILISYFIAVSLGLIGGTHLTEFMAPLLPADLAENIMRGLVLTLSMLVLTGIGRRHAALVLSLVVFFSSYVTLYAGGDVGLFWRDLALVGALLMTADLTNPNDKEIDWNTATLAPPEKPATSREAPDPIDPLDDQPFREDLDIARAN